MLGTYMLLAVVRIGALVTTVIAIRVRVGAHICSIVKPNLVIVLHTLPLLLCHFVNTTAYLLDRYKPSSVSTI